MHQKQRNEKNVENTIIIRIFFVIALNGYEKRTINAIENNFPRLNIKYELFFSFFSLLCLVGVCYID